jgi:probable HAF family extracellular repeat protein
MVDLRTLGGTSISGASTASAVNKHGQVVGDGDFVDTAGFHAFSWTQEGGMVDLGILGGERSSAFAVNDRGQVVGWSDTTGNVEIFSHAFSWTEEGGMVDLGTLGGTSSLAVAVNDRGQVVGYTLGDTGFHAAVWRLKHGNN